MFEILRCKECNQFFINSIALKTHQARRKKKGCKPVNCKDNWLKKVELKLPFPRILAEASRNPKTEPPKLLEILIRHQADAGANSNANARGK